MANGENNGDTENTGTSEDTEESEEKEEEEEEEEEEKETENTGGVRLNPQITDAITQSNAAVLGQAPSVAMGTLYQVTANQFAMASANAVFSQQQANIAYQAATTLGVAKLLSLKVAPKPKPE